ncbi:17-beta-hydroxysteroid dehydrogenase 13-like isoform X3 [Colletes gigas]|uniref:17-beta-hydroxysteroid dehydrogenase 13-like isoform X3 n=1 Tax=Colletes gigas TaxID=935657 RepID=UPI001C9B2C04|nr:17-beta-hydroxysteroid dehydrogenase 13-like isoform X3 [Colletes gigas]
MTRLGLHFDLITSFRKMESLRRSFKPPKMLIKLYSLFILILDLATLLIGIFFAILIAVYRTFRPPPLKSLHGEVAMIVGAGRGIGRELAIHLCQLGVSVACVDINVENCNTTVLSASQGIGIAKPYICNVTIKNELLETVLPCMEQTGKGHIVVLSSVAGLSGGATGGSRVPLSTAQFAVQGLAESLHTELRHSNSNIIITLVHVYPFIVGAEAAKDIRFRIPSYFGTMPAAEAAKQILDGVRRNYAEFSVPGYLLYLGHVLRILPKKASFMLRDLLDTGVDFG